MARPKRFIPIQSVKLYRFSSGGRDFYKTFSSATGAARFFAERVAHKLTWNRPTALTYPPQLQNSFVKFTYDSDEYNRLYKAAYRRSFKIFKALGMK